MPPRSRKSAPAEPAPEEGAEATPDPGEVWRNRIVGTGVARVDQLTGNPNNVRIHPKRQQEAMVDLLTEVGYVQNVIVNRSTGYVLDGHMRVELAISAGQELIPVVYVELDEDEELLLQHAYDSVGTMAAFQREVLAEQTPLARARTIPGSALDMWLEELARRHAPKAEPFYPDDGEVTEDGTAAPSEDAAVAASAPPPPTPVALEVVQILLPRDEYDDFVARCSTLMSAHGHASVTEAVVAAVEAAYDALSAQEVE